MNKLTKIAIAFVAAGLASNLFAEPATQPSTQPSAQPTGDKVMCESGLTIITVEAAGDYVTRKGDHVWVHYAGRLENGTEFDNSYKKGEPIDLTIGAHRVIAGWEEGLLGMKIGEKRQLIIPASLGWGDRGAGDAVPPNATTIFDVELVGVKKG